MTHTGWDNSPPSDRVKQQGHEFTSVRENLASGYFSSVEQLPEAWIRSDGHCAKILDC